MKIELRPAKRSDAIPCHLLEIKGQEFPLSKEEVGKLFDDEKLAKLIVTVDGTPRAYFAAEVSKTRCDIKRLAIEGEYIGTEVLTKIVVALSTPPADVSISVSENDTTTHLFQRLLDHGFRGQSLVAGDRFEYGSLCDSIILVRPSEAV